MTPRPSDHCSSCAVPIAGCCLLSRLRYDGAGQRGDLKRSKDEPTVSPIVNSGGRTIPFAGRDAWPMPHIVLGLAERSRSALAHE
jgi:hypothetical protein